MLRRNLQMIPGIGGGQNAESEQPTTDVSHEQTSEGFICPQCMKSHSSAEDLSKHYELFHDTGDLPAHVAPTREDRSRLRQEVQDLHTSVKNDGQMSSEDSVLEMKLKGSETVARLAAEIVDIKSRYDKEKSLREAADQKTELLQQENEKLQTELQATDEQVATLRRKVDDTTAAMQELGRENQSLRVSEPQSLPFQRRAASYLLRLVLTIKQSQSLARKWAEDHEVRNCMTCHKGFSVTVRKHHCRQCGKIFCAECSSRKALMPFSTKPVRVCETCFEELQG
ncbi:early endosome antigen 1-like isoform X1 [Syngnathus typhle]|uniref:early endosome antigen 1-like isoform X1 n=1 Tax=Syngnathus typhle TaxID=161592 RepID=UPI002A6B3654|nr:early endosome antigen 1-like isoform X1 [Syngnathus typhle]